MSADALALRAPTSQERVLAGGLNVAAIFLPCLGPIAGLALSDGSKFVKFNAYRCLVEQIVRTVLIGLIVLASLSYSMYSMVRDGVFDNGFDLSKIDWVAIIVKSAVTWIAFAVWGIWNTIGSIKDALQAFSGRMPQRMGWVNRRAAKWAGLSPNV